MMANDKYTEPKRKRQVWRLWKDRDDFQPRRILKYLGLSETFAGTWKISRSGNTTVEQEKHSLNFKKK